MADKEGPTVSLEMDCLKPTVTSTSTELHKLPSHLPRDIGIFPAYYIIEGPLKVNFLKKGKWSIPAYPQVVQTYTCVVKCNRKTKYDRWFS